MNEIANRIIKEIMDIPGVFVKKEDVIKIVNDALRNVEYPVLEYNEFIIDMNSYTVSIDGNNIRLPRKQFKLVYHLAKDPGRVISRREILRDIWGTDVIVGERTIDVHIRKIRRALPTLPLKTIKCVGYKLQD